MATLDFDTFGQIMDDFIKEAPIQMLIEMPAGTTDAKIRDNTQAGPVMQLYIILNAVEAIYKSMCELLDIDTD